MYGHRETWLHFYTIYWLAFSYKGVDPVFDLSLLHLFEKTNKLLNQ